MGQGCHKGNHLVGAGGSENRGSWSCVQLSMGGIGEEVPEELLNAIFSTECYSQKGLFKALDCQGS